MARSSWWLATVRDLWSAYLSRWRPENYRAIVNRHSAEQRADQYRCTPVARLLNHSVRWIRPIVSVAAATKTRRRMRNPCRLIARRRGAFIINLATGRLKGSEINNCLRKRWTETSRFAVAVFVLLIRVSRGRTAERCSAAMRTHFALISRNKQWIDSRNPRHLLLYYVTRLQVIYLGESWIFNTVFLKLGFQSLIYIHLQLFHMVQIKSIKFTSYFIHQI